MSSEAHQELLLASLKTASDFETPKKIAALKVACQQIADRLAALKELPKPPRDGGSLPIATKLIKIFDEHHARNAETNAKLQEVESEVERLRLEAAKVPILRAELQKALETIEKMRDSMR